MSTSASFSDAVVRGGHQLEGVAPDPEAGPLEGLVVALVLEVDQVAQDGVPPVLAALAQAEDGRPVVDRGTQAIDAADAGHDDHVAPLEEGVGRGVPELVDLVVPAGVLLDVRVGPGQVRLGLVVVEVADEVLDRVVGEELAELGVELGGEGLVVGQHEGRFLVLGDRVGDRPCLARAGHTEQGLVAHPRLEAVDQALDGGRLVPRRFEVGDESEIRHDGRSEAPGWESQDTTPSTNRTGVLLPPGCLRGRRSVARLRAAAQVRRSSDLDPCRARSMSILRVATIPRLESGPDRLHAELDSPSKPRPRTATRVLSAR